jgi:NAD(P)-dependent dehydrogenase (short-subunit alcohol dehydrogenase family)
MSSELAPLGITINAISPARVHTERAVELSKQTAASRGVAVEVVEAEALKAIPTGRLIEPTEIAEVALLLASGRVPSLTGAEIVVDGGTSNYM